jgi:predicted acylesterase/phospholipase RssA
MSQSQSDDLKTVVRADAKDNFMPDILILGPGGVKGFLHLGACFLLEKKGILKGIKTIVGVSIGAVIGLLYAVGYNSSDIMTHALAIDLFQDLSSMTFEDIKKNVGLLSNDEISKKLRELVIVKYGFEVSLKQLYEFSAIELVCVTNNMTRRAPEYLSYKTHPHMNCVDAVLLSMNIPGLLFRITYQNNVYSDGALVDPYPIRKYDDGKNKILGLYIDEPSGVTNGSSALMYLVHAIATPMRQLRECSIRDSSNNCRHIRLKSDIIDSLGLAVGIIERARMISEGYETAKETLAKMILTGISEKY